MYPLNVVVVNCPENELSTVHGEVARIPAHVEADFPTFDSLFLAPTFVGQHARMLVIHVETQADLESLEKTSCRFSGWPILVITRAVNDQRIVFESMRRGAAQIVRLPIASEDFGRAMHCIARQFGFRPHLSQVVAVVGATGGCGRATIAINLAERIAREREHDCVLVDLSLKMGVLTSRLDVTPRFTIHDLLADSGRIDARSIADALIPAGDNLRVLTGPTSLAEGPTTSHDEIRVLIDYLRRLCEIVVLVVPPPSDAAFSAAISAADRVVLVAEQSVPSIYSLKCLLDRINHEFAKTKPIVVINRYSAGRTGLSNEEIQSRFDIKHLITIANDHGAVGGAIDRGVFIHDYAPHSRVLVDIERLAHELAEQGALPKKRRRSFWHILTDLFHRERLDASQRHLMDVVRGKIVPELEQFARELPLAVENIEEIPARLDAIERRLHRAVLDSVQEILGDRFATAIRFGHEIKKFEESSDVVVENYSSTP